MSSSGWASSPSWPSSSTCHRPGRRRSGGSGRTRWHRRPRFEAYLAASSARTVGCLTLFSTYSTFRALPLLYIEDIFVLEAYRRRGVGQALFDFCLRLASERGCARLEWNVLRWNEAAVRFYAKNNATRVDDWVWYRRGRFAGERGLAIYP